MIDKAKQIWIDSAEVNTYIESKQEFVCENTSFAELKIYCETEYAVFINSQFAGTGQYKSMPDIRVFDTYDISKYLNTGKNEIFVIAHHQGIGSSMYAPSKAGLTYSIELNECTVLSGEETLVRVSPYYKSGAIEKMTNQLGPVYHYNASNNETPWVCPTVIESDAVFVPRPVKKLVHKPLNCGKILSQGALKRDYDDSKTPAQFIQSDFLSYRPYNEIFDENGYISNDSYFIIDLQTETAGLLNFELEAHSGTTIDIGFGEHLDDLRVRSYIGLRNFAVRYICKEGKQDFTGYFRRIAGRYLQIHITGINCKIKFNKIGIIPTEYPLDRIAHFKCDDYLFNRIYTTSVETLKLCMHEHYEDCPWREQALYGFDSYVQMMCGYYAFGEYEFAKASLKLLANSQREDGLLNITSPNTSNYTIPSFSLAWIISLEKYVLYSGDTDFGNNMLNVAENILKAFPVEDDLVQTVQKDSYWHFYEWRDGASRATGNTDCLINLYYILASEAYNRICKKEIFDTTKIKEKIQLEFFDIKKGLYKTENDSKLYHELTQSLAILCGIGNDRMAEKLVSKNNELIETSLSTSIFKYDAVLSQNLKHIDTVIDEIADIWGKMLYSGALTFWETEDGADDFDKAGSLCHGWSAVPVFVLYKYVLGFEPLKPGFAEYKISQTNTKNIKKGMILCRYITELTIII